MENAYETVQTVQHSEEISSNRVEGTTVFNRSGEKLGSIADLIINKRSGQVRYAVMEFGGFLGIGSDRYPLPWNILEYSPQYSGYVVPLDKSTLEGAPSYANDAVPEYTTDYGRKVHNYYGVEY